MILRVQPLPVSSVQCRSALTAHQAALYRRWLVLAGLARSGKLSWREEVPSPLPGSYSDAKLGSKKFQLAKQALYKVD